MNLQNSFYKKILKEKFNLTDNIEEIVSKDPKKYCIDTLYNINDLPNNKIQRFVLQCIYRNTSKNKVKENHLLINYLRECESSMT